MPVFITRLTEEDVRKACAYWVDAGCPDEVHDGVEITTRMNGKKLEPRDVEITVEVVGDDDT